MFQMRGTLFFFFKQKTAYEMRISDWSSDVCSSDLPARRTLVEPRGIAVAAPMAPGVERLSPIGQPRTVRNGPTQSVQRRIARRSEEHTSELQSLMRVSYAVFCLKKKKKEKAIP